MILNFSTGSSLPSTAPKRKFEGGSWKDRARAKRRAQNATLSRLNDNGAGRLVSANQVPIAKIPRDEFPDERPAKRRKDSPDGSTSVESYQRPERSQGGGRLHVNGSRDFVSSLFTSNPVPTQSSPESKDKPEETPSKPSNAPLLDEVDTFTSLGLSRTIATHLLTKMKLKNPTAIQKAAVSQMLAEDGDAFIQSETGSGKTLAYLLPIFQRIMQMSEHQNGQIEDDNSLHRDSGLFAIVLAPTRELCKQISVVLERLLGCANYIVAGTVIGGEKKKSEKARLRKGFNILVATPGRLVDHLDNTSALDVSNVRWLVLDEGDRLMDLGFEQDITKIITTLDQRKKTTSRTILPDRRTTVLCSATLKMNVQKLGEISLKDAALIKGDADEPSDNKDGEVTDSAFLAPAQLRQSYMVVPAKLRLVTLAAFLRRTFARKGSVSKAIVFVSCADSVDFHFKVFTSSISTSEPVSPPPSDEDTSPSLEVKTPSPGDDCISAAPTLTSSTSEPLTVFKLHGSLPQPTRTSIVNQFRTSTATSLLIATDVASRGLDLPNLDLVIEYDPAFSSDDHLHRIGRTARLGRDGRATIFLLPGKEEGYVDVLRRSYKPTLDATANVSHTNTNDILRKGFSPTSGIVSTSQKEWEQRATDFQLDVERWVLSNQEHKDMAKRAFQSHVRAYATHIAAERKWFDIKDLHLGHLAKGFGLRDAPGMMNVMGMRGKKESGRRRVGSGGNAEGKGSEETKVEREERPGADADAARKMREMVKRQRMMGGGADEFNLA